MGGFRLGELGKEGEARKERDIMFMREPAMSNIQQGGLDTKQIAAQIITL